ncbi:transcriptional regulator, LysR family [Kribbella flavida DSM 17836]|uniref:Transcriptional regulator, LysR family n=1 Tax=Kribbella flavida (strain DSM 17836 / JCM 10339 / NBRC 14399) TaxID=479435 RepID=D2PLV7_KRIFD|nr:LysR family transcriptional regulator [Kribbella flavida]ADB32537.1 transcriptional regulator, LysR family [Kribbella flavida DSM 17836]
MLDVRRLRLLRDLAHLGTIAAVAEAHSYTPPAVSQQLAVLEREAGMPLLERTGRRVVLTPAGELLVRHAEKVLSALEEASSALTAVRGRLSGPLRIGAFPTAVRSLLPDALVSLGHDHPGLELSVTELDPVDAPAALRERRIDVALVNDYDVQPAAPDAAVATEPLLEEIVFLAVRDGSRIRSIEDAEGCPWIAGTPGTACHTVTLHACGSAGYRPVVRHTADDFDAVLALVAAGLGVSLVPELATGHPPAGVRLVPLSIRRRTGIACRSGAASHPAVAAFVAAVRAAA